VESAVGDQFTKHGCPIAHGTYADQRSEFVRVNRYMRPVGQTIGPHLKTPMHSGLDVFLGEKPDGESSLCVSRGLR
jgi:hypothetical protein